MGKKEKEEKMDFLGERDRKAQLEIEAILDWQVTEDNQDYRVPQGVQ